MAWGGTASSSTTARSPICPATVTGIKKGGQIVGSGAGGHAFLLDRGTFTMIDFPGTGTTTWPTGINDRGQIVGFIIGPGDISKGESYHGFLLE